MGLGDVFFWLLVAGLVGVVVAIIARGSVGDGGGAGMSAMTALHDLSPADKQRAIEIVVEKKAGRKWLEQATGEGKEPGQGATPESGSRPPEVTPPIPPAS